MKKYLRLALLALFGFSLLWAITFLISSNSKSTNQYETYSPYFSSIENKTIIAGKVVPQKEIKIKPQISGIIEKVSLVEGVALKKGDLIATIKIIPNEQALYQAKGRVKNAEIALNYAEVDFNRNKNLSHKGVIADGEFQKIRLAYDQAKLESENAINDYQIISKGSIGKVGGNTQIRSTIDGTLIEIHVNRGDQVMPSNNFFDGTTIATIADFTKMNFEGKVNESKVAKLKVGMPLEITLGANRDKKLKADLKFISPKRAEEPSYVQFKIEGNIKIEDGLLVRSGYSANASLTLDKKDSILVIPEALLQFKGKTNEPYVEVAIGNQEFERRDVEIGISNGIIAEIVSGLTIKDRVKQWNKTEPINTGTKRTQKSSL